MQAVASHPAGSAKGGKSRFSKALPAPPPVAPSLSFSESTSLPQHLPPTPRKHLLPTTTTSTTAPSLTRQALSTPQAAISAPATAGAVATTSAAAAAAAAPTAPPPASSLPPLPLLPPKNLTMAIPRRPVGGRPASPAQESPAQTSPVTSISSVLSAYSFGSSAPSQRSSATASTLGAASTKGSHCLASKGASPVEDNSSVTVDHHGPMSTDTTKTWQGPAAQEEPSTPPPPLPPKDATGTAQPSVHQVLPTSPSRHGRRDGPSLIDTLMGTPPQDPQPSPQIWKRRSLKSDQIIEVTPLRLNECNINHGTVDATTAASEDISPHPDAEAIPRPVSRDSASPPPPPPKTAAPAGTLAFPGRAIRPADRPARAHEAVQNTAPVVVGAPSRAARLPTPEYGTDDVQKLVSPDARSPDSPAASPTLESEARPTQTHAVSDARLAIPCKAIGVAGSERAVRAVPSAPDLAAQSSDIPAVPSLRTAGPPLRGPMLRSPPGLPGSPSPGVSRIEHDPSELSRFPLRGSSRPATHGGSFGPKPRPSMGRVHPEPTQSVSDAASTASDGTLRPGQQPVSLHTSAQQNVAGFGMRTSELQPIDEVLAPSHDPDEATTTDHAGAALFPRNWYQPMSDDGVLKAAPLKQKHFDCLHNHKTMFPSSQQYNPISCATCGKKETKPEVRYWSCSCCHVRVCGACRDELHQSFRGNLKAFVDDLESRAWMNMYSTVPGEGVYHATHKESGVMGMDGGAAAVVPAAAMQAGPA